MWCRRLMILVLAAALAGCAGGRQRQLERVAKDWCQTIRASQVLPVYPLTEDMQPGDVFLVNTTIGQQTETYKKHGFLPLDQPVTRLHDLDYASYYQDGYWTGNYAQSPHPRPAPGVTAVEAPRVAFPSYTFKVKSGAGLKLALPIKGVPFGLNLMKAKSATGSVTIGDAYSYGAATEDVYVKLQTWARDFKVANELRRLAVDAEASGDGPLYVRVISRVFLTKKVDVSLVNTESRGGRADAGDAKGVEPLEIEDQATAANFKATMTALNETANRGLPGGTINIAQASERSVTLAETFDRPLVFGFLGFDVPILLNGDLGSPVPTFVQLENRARVVEALPTAGNLSPAQRRMANRMYSLQGMIHRQKQAEAMQAIAIVADHLPDGEFGAIAKKAKQSQDWTREMAEPVLDSFWEKLDVYAAGEVNRHEDVIDMIDRALERGDE